MTRFSRFSEPALWFLVAGFPVLLILALQACQSFQNDVYNWQPKESTSRVAFDRFVSAFGSPEFAVISWPDCTLTDIRLREIEDCLRDDSWQDRLAMVLSGQSVLEELTVEAELSRSLAKHRLTPLLFHPESKESPQTALIVRLTPHGAARRAATLHEISEVLQTHDVAPHEVRMGGPTVELQLLDYEGFWSPLRVIPLILFSSLVLSWVFLRDLGLTVFIQLLGAFTSLLSLSLVAVSGVPLNAIVWTLPTLILLLTVSASFHFLGYFRDAYSKSVENPVAMGLATAWKPTVFCAATTAAGLFSLWMSDTSPIRQFGVFGGCSVVCSCCLVLWCLPAYLRFARVRPRPPLKLVEALWPHINVVTNRAAIPLALLCFLLMLGAACYLPQLSTTANILNAFPRRARAVEDDRWLEESAFPTSTVEIMLAFDGVKDANHRDRIQRLATLCHDLNAIPEIKSTLSAATLCPVLPKPRSGVAGILQKRTNFVKIESLVRSLPSVGLMQAQSGDTQTWRVSARMSATDDVNFDNFKARIDEAVEHAFGTTAGPCLNDEFLTTTYSGQRVILAAIEKQFLEDLKATYLMAFIVVTVVVMLLLRSAADCAIATLPNIFPALVVLGFTAMNHIALDVASLMTASVALGIAVDDTLHFMLWRREKLKQGWSQEAAVKNSLQHCGTAMLQTSVICGLSLALYGLSGFTPTARFGLLLASMLLAALFGDIILLPSLLRLSPKKTG